MAAAAAAGLIYGTPAAAQVRDYNVPAESASKAIATLAKQGNVQILLPGRTARGIRTHAVFGSMSVDEALATMLAGTGLHAQESGAQTWIIVPLEVAHAEAAPPRGASATSESVDILVTGTRVRGAPPASPVIRVTQAGMRAAGQNTIADALRSIPQNFSGGQNPNVLFGATVGGTSNQNISGGSSIDLRGLGPDATLTLFNGHRLSYNSFGQGVDVSVIPVAALDRIEIIADGASAIYGSDAVAGVANVILKRDFSGLTTFARLGQATRGGDFQQQYSAVAGKTWSTGGLIATYDFERDTAIYSSSRGYVSYLQQPYMLLPSQRHNSVVVSGHQEVGKVATFTIDALFSSRVSRSIYTTLPITRNNGAKDNQYSIAPAMRFNLPQSWTLTLNGVYGRDAVDRDASIVVTATGAVSSRVLSCYCNDLRSIEANAEGPLFHLPGGEARSAVGGGFRRNIYHFENPTIGQSGSQNSAFGYAELFLPFVGEENSGRFLNKLSFTGAIRYENYQDIGDIATPKLAIIYAPSAGLEIKGSWGRSFKAPTLDQRVTPTQVLLYPAATLGGVGFPAAATVLFPSGGNPELKPERAATWTATLAFHPAAAPAFRAELSYFNVTYKDRIISPFATTNILSNPAYQEFVIFNPSEAAKQATLASAAGGLVNVTNAPYNAANVVAIAKGQYTNVAVQKADGIDISFYYNFNIGASRIGLTDSASYLHSTQRNSLGAATVPLAGTVYNPPKIRERTGLSVERGALLISSFANYVGGVTDTTKSPIFHGNAMLTFDLVGVLTSKADTGPLRGVVMSLSINNILDQQPPFLLHKFAYQAAFDSTNYSAVGRFVSLSVSKDW